MMSGLYVALMLRRLRFDTPAGNPLTEDGVFGLAVLPQPHSLHAARRQRLQGPAKL